MAYDVESDWERGFDYAMATCVRLIDTGAWDTLEEARRDLTEALEAVGYDGSF